MRKIRKKNCGSIGQIADAIGKAWARSKTNLLQRGYLKTSGQIGIGSFMLQLTQMIKNDSQNQIDLGLFLQPISSVN